MQRTLSVTELIDNAAHLEASEFDLFFKNLLLLNAQRIIPNIPAAETELLKKINKGFPEKKWHRLYELNEKLEALELSEDEELELGALNESYEKYKVQRVQYLGQLAKLRKVSLRTVMQQLNIEANHYGN